MVFERDLFPQDVAVAAHADLKPIQRTFDSSGHEFDEGVLRQALVRRRAVAVDGGGPLRLRLRLTRPRRLPPMQLAKQQAELRAAQRDGWIPPLQRLHILLPSFPAQMAPRAATRGA